MIVISYYTPNNDYPKFAKNLKENLEIKKKLENKK